MRTKKVLLIGLPLMIILVVVAGFLFYRATEREKSFAPKLKPEYQSFHYPTAEDTDARAALTPLQTDEYTLSYPGTWEVTLQPIAGGGSSTDFTIAGSAANEPAADVSIQGTSVSDTPLQQVEKVYTSFGYKKENVSINGEPAVKFSGAMGDMREVAYVLEHNEVVYNIHLTYVSDQSDAAMERHFDDVVNSLTFH